MTAFIARLTISVGTKVLESNVKGEDRVSGSKQRPDFQNIHLKRAKKHEPRDLFLILITGVILRESNLGNWC